MILEQLQGYSYMPIFKINTTWSVVVWICSCGIMDGDCKVIPPPTSQRWRSGAPNSLPHPHCFRVNCTCLFWLPCSFKRHFICSASSWKPQLYIWFCPLPFPAYPVSKFRILCLKISWNVLSIPIHALVLLLYSLTWSPFFSNHFHSLILSFQSIGFMSYYYLFLEKEMATHSSILAWRIPWTEEPGGLQSKGSQRVGHKWAINNTQEETEVWWLLNGRYSLPPKFP